MTSAALFRAEIAASVLGPYFDVAREVTVDGMEKTLGLVPKGSSRVRKSKLVVDEAAHDSRRHFAMTHTESLVVVCAPEMIDLPECTIVGILLHEMGHVADFAYPGAFLWPRGRQEIRSTWVGTSAKDRALAWRTYFGRARAVSQRDHDDALPAANWMRAWEDRSEDEVEYAADEICFLLTGERIGYSGPCVLQTLCASRPRPKGLR